ncbi:MAG: TonB-dependent receptor plug domain-containing protein [Bacteroidales bacterium]
MKPVSCILLFLLQISIVLSQNSLKDTVKLDEVTVTAIKPQKADNSVIPMQSMSRTELDKISGNTVADAIKTFSGITLKDYGGIGGLKTVMVRSLGANHTSVFFNGVQFTDAATGQVDLGKITIENAESVSLFVGQSNNICQPARFYSSASVIQIESTNPNFAYKKFHFNSSLKTGSFGLISPFVSIQWKTSTNSYFDLSLLYNQAHGAYPYKYSLGTNFDSTFKRNNSDIKALNLNANYKLVNKDSSSWFFYLYYYNSERGLPGAIVFYNPVSNQRLWNNDLFSNIQFKSNTTKQFSFMTNLKFSQLYLRYLDPEYLNIEGKLDNHYNQREFYVSQAIAYRMTDLLNLGFASDFFVNTLTSNLYNYATPTRYSSLNALTFQYKSERWESNGNVLLTYVKEKTLTGNAAPQKLKLTPSFSLGYKLLQNPTLRLRFLYKDIFRMPTFNDLYYTLVGNNNLLPEQAKQFNLGFTGNSKIGFIEYFSFKTDAFYNKVKDKIVAIPTKNLFVWSMRNIGVVDIKGVEMQFDLQTKPILKQLRYTFSCNYTYQKATDVTTPGSVTYGNQIPYVPFETFSSKSGVTYKDFSFNYNLLFNGFRYVLGENIYENMIPGWWISDITILYAYHLNKITLKIKAEVSNLFNKQYEVIKSFPMPGRAYWTTLSINY